MDGPILECALQYADAGHRLMPIWSVRPNGWCDCPDGVTCPSPGKHPHGRLAPNGLKDASDDPETIKAWWRQYPVANIGLVTGDQFFVVDCDKHDSPEGSIDGTALFLKLAQDYGGIPDTAAADTGGGGAHFCFAMDPDVPVRNQQGLLVDGVRIHGIDVRGEGGYIVAPPSLHASGKMYVWARDLLGHLKPAPPWLLELVASLPQEQAPAPVYGTTISTPETSLPDHETGQIKTALALMPANCDRETWLERVGMPLHNIFGGSEQGFQVWHDWCATAKGQTTPNGNQAYRGEGECRKVWQSLSRRHVNPKGRGTFWQYAQECGFQLSGQPVIGVPVVVAPETAESTFTDDEIQWAFDEAAKNPGPFPQSVIANLEGPIASLTSWIVACSRRQDPVLAFGAALGLVSAAIGRRLLGPMETGADMALAILAPSGAGKDKPQECIKNLLDAHPNLLVGRFDDTPIHRAQLDSRLLKNRGQCLLLLDEYGAVLTRWLRGLEASNTMSPVIRRLIGHGRTRFDLAVLSPKNPQFAEDPEGWKAGIFAPCLTLLGFATAGQFYESLSEAALIDGFLGRHVVIATTQPYALVQPAASSSEAPEMVHHWLGSLESIAIPRTAPSTTMVLPDGAPAAPPDFAHPSDPRDVAWASEDVELAFSEMTKQLDQLGLKALEASDDLGVALLRRLPGQVMKFTLLLAVGEVENAADAIIEERHLEAAYRIARWSADHLAWRLRSGVAYEAASRAQVRILEAVERAAGKRVYRSRFASKVWASLHLGRIWPLLQQDPRLIATDRWAELRPKAKSRPRLSVTETPEAL